MRGVMIGIECVFTELDDFWYCFEAIARCFDNFKFNVVDNIIFSKGYRICIPDQFDSNYIYHLINLSFVCDVFLLHSYVGDVIDENIETYEDFLLSNCEMIILVYDCWNMEVYIKDKDKLVQFTEMIKNNQSIIFTIKTIENDGRTGMYV
jgi:hypothetical protein